MEDQTHNFKIANKTSYPLDHQCTVCINGMYLRLFFLHKYSRIYIWKNNFPIIILKNILIKIGLHALNKITVNIFYSICSGF